MTHVISVITPVHGPSLPYIAEAYSSLAAQELPTGWEWQWLVQEDGRTGNVAKMLPNDPRINSGMGRPGGGPAIARNMALARADGDIVRVLDADDRLLPSALARNIETMTGRTNVGWTTSRVLDLMPDGSTVSWEHADPREGPIIEGTVLEYFKANQFRLPVHPATLCIRRDLLLALGGWMALPAGEDSGLLLAASVVSEGYFIHEPGLLYRKHPDQLTKQAAHMEPAEWTARMMLIEARAEALRDLLGKP